MIRDVLFFFSIQQKIFGICPHSGQFFRLSECKLYLKTKPQRDWLDKLDSRNRQLDTLEGQLEEKEESMREKARTRGRRLANLAIRKIDSVFRPCRLNPDDAKVLFHPVDYVVFCGMKQGSRIKKIVLLDRVAISSGHRKVQDSIANAINRKQFEWKTIRVHSDGKISEK
jgi:predicted Holliday junction resolvase-like endonuclease